MLTNLMIQVYFNNIYNSLLYCNKKQMEINEDVAVFTRDVQIKSLNFLKKVSLDSFEFIYKFPLDY